MRVCIDAVVAGDVALEYTTEGVSGVVGDSEAELLLTGEPGLLVKTGNRTLSEYALGKGSRRLSRLDLDSAPRDHPERVRWREIVGVRSRLRISRCVWKCFECVPGHGHGRVEIGVAVSRADQLIHMSQIRRCSRRRSVKSRES
jgi:hypothetical protein